MVIGTDRVVAQTPFGDCNGGRGGGSVRCPYGNDTPAQAGGPAATHASSAPSNVRWEPTPRLADLADGTVCSRMEYRPVPADSPEPEFPWDPSTVTVSHAGVPAYPCPAAPRSPQDTAIAVAMRAWEEVPLPVPKPQIAPGRAITGKWAYLETRGQTRFEFQKVTEVGTLHIRAMGAYSVDWGDGEKSGPHTVEGKPWPEGEIRHDYLWVGSYDVVVTERWTATWQLGPWSGTLRSLQTAGRIDDFPVQQIQAVIRS
jgi:hypothetical protein